MLLEKVDYNFLHEESLREYIKTLQGISSRNFAPIQCDQGSTENYKKVHACDYAVSLIEKELAEMEDQKKKMYAELDAKYGVRGKDYFVTMAGTVEGRKDHE